MPRARLIKPEFFDDEKLSSISRDARLVFPGLWIFSDDYGVVKGNHEWLLSKIFPYERDIKISQFSNWLKELEQIDCIRPFQVNGESYYYISHFNNHQTINKPSQTRNPTPPDTLLNQCSSPTLPLPSEVEIKSKEEIEKEINTPSQKVARESVSKIIKSKKPIKTFLPENFIISDSIISWAKKYGFESYLEAHLEYFKDYAIAGAIQAVDWDAKFRNAIRLDWGNVRAKMQSGNGDNKPRDNCVNHPDKRGVSQELDGKWYCRSCLDAIEKQQFPKLDGMVKNLTQKMKMEDLSH